MNLASSLRRSFVALKAAVVAAQISLTEIQDEFYEDFASEATGRYWWWIRMVLLEPNELIVDDGENNLYRVSFAIGAGADEDADGDPNIVFGEPIPVKIEYVDVAARSEVVNAVVGGMARARGDERVAARFESREESRLNVNEGGQMREYIEKMRAKLGLAATVSDEQVLAAAATALEAESGEQPAPGEGSGDGTEGTDEGDEGEEGAGQGGEGTGSGEAQTQQVDAGALAQLRADAAQGVEARRILQQREDEAFLSAAVSAGKFPPSRVRHYEALMRVDREGTIELVNELAENVIPLRPTGANGGGEGQGAKTNLHESLLAAHAPDVLARKQAIMAGTQVRQRVFSDA